MQKTVPSFGRVLTMVLFALSCFGLLLFLWLSFGGVIPLAPKGYRVQIAFPQAAQLAQEADVRIAGVTVGKVKKIALDPRGNRTLATLELQRRFAPLRQDARATLRQKTLLGETYVELTTGTQQDPSIPDGGRLADARVAPAVQLDEVLQTFDTGTRQAFQQWQQRLGRAGKGRAEDFSNFLGNLPAFTGDATSLLTVLDQQSGAVRRLVRNTGTTFGALAKSQSALRNLITGSAQTFAATASQNRALAETFQVFPTFLDESKATFARLRSFALDTDPLIQELRPSARALVPTLRSVRLLAPDLRRFFVNLDPLIRVSQTGLPALRDTLNGLRPLLGQLGPFLEQLNPILRWLELYQHQVGDFLTSGPAALSKTVYDPTTPYPNAGHILSQIVPQGAESLGGFFQNRPAIDRGNTYIPPIGLSGPAASKFEIFPNYDCFPSTGSWSRSASKPPDTMGPKDNPGTKSPGCYVPGSANDPQDVNDISKFQGPQGRYPHVNAARYGTGGRAPRHGHRRTRFTG